VEQPSTAGDAISVAKNLLAAFKNRTVYSFIRLGLAMPNFSFFFFIYLICVSMFILFYKRS